MKMLKAKKRGRRPNMLCGRQVLEELNDFSRLDPESEDSDLSGDEFDDDSTQTAPVCVCYIVHDHADVCFALVCIPYGARQQQEWSCSGTNSHAACTTRKSKCASETHSLWSSYSPTNATCSTNASVLRYSASNPSSVPTISSY